VGYPEFEPQSLHITMYISVSLGTPSCKLDLAPVLPHGS